MPGFAIKCDYRSASTSSSNNNLIKAITINIGNIKAILALSKEAFFEELEFTIYGKGELFSKLLTPLKQFSNVKIYNRFLAHDEIAREHKKHGKSLPYDTTDEEFDRMILKDSEDLSVWTLNTVVGYEQNRAISYPANYFHSKYPNKSWKEGREVFVMFYKTEINKYKSIILNHANK